MTLDLEAIKARAEAATKGPWGARELPQMVRGANATLHSAHGTGEVWSVEFSPEIGSTVSISDAEFIAHARTDIPALIAEVERLRGIVDRVREVHAPEVQTVSVPVFDEFDSPTQTDTYCAGCGGWGSSQKLHRLCPTIRALEDQ